MSWPTQEQFDHAHRLGTEYALQEIQNGATEPQEAPLSGEWADGMTERTIAGNVGYYPSYDSMETAEDLTELADAWERGYNDLWRNHGPEEQEEARERFERLTGLTA